MKRLLLLVAVLLLFTVAMRAQEIIEVTLLEQSTIPEEQIPRTPSSLTITCLVIFNNIYLSFSESPGMVRILLEEEGEGPVVQTSINCSNLYTIIPFTRGPGDYSITLTLSSGSVYVGQFNI